MTDLDDTPLDFEFDALKSSPILNAKKRKKVIGMDDLLSDHFKEQNKFVKCKKKKKLTSYSSDEEDAKQAAKESEIAQVLNDASSKYEEMKNEEESSPWNVVVFQKQGDFPTVAHLNIEKLKLTQSFAASGFDLLDIKDVADNKFFEGLLVNGWLSKLVFIRGHVESALAKWALDLIFYSTKEDLRSAACSFWCDNLLTEEKIIMDYVPTYSEFKKALEVYGYAWDSSKNAHGSQSAIDDLENCVPPQNIRAWIQLVTACCQCKGLPHPFLVTSEAEELAGYIISMFLDRRVLGLSMLMSDCLVSVICLFSDEEWDQSCERIAKHLACRVPKDLNSLRIVKCLPGVNMRSKLLKSKLAFEILISCLAEVTDAYGILNFLISTDVMEDNCNLFNIYIYLGLTENWLLNTPALEHEKELYQLWKKFLKNCSRIGAPSDWRSYASKVKSKVAYLTACVISS